RWEANPLLWSPEIPEMPENPYPAAAIEPNPTPQGISGISGISGKHNDMAAATGAPPADPGPELPECLRRTPPKNAKPPEECHPKDWQPSAKLAAFGAASTADNDADPDLSVPATNGGGALADDGGNVDRAPGAMPIEGEIVQPPSWRELNTKMMKSRRWRPTGGNAPK